LLCSIVSPSLEPHVSVTVHLSNSIEWKLGDKIEWSVDMESEFFVESLGLNLSSFIKINNLPLLVKSISLSKNSNCLTLNILVSSDIEVLSVLDINESVNLILKDLEPL
jgi:hypothetical protein